MVQTTSQGSADTPRDSAALLPHRNIKQPHRNLLLTPSITRQPHLQLRNPTMNTLIPFALLPRQTLHQLKDALRRSELLVNSLIWRTNSLDSTNRRCYTPSAKTHSTLEPWTPPRQVNTTTFRMDSSKLTPLLARTSFTSHRDVLKGEYPYGNSFSNMSMIVLDTLAPPNATSLR